MKSSFNYKELEKVTRHFLKKDMPFLLESRDYLEKTKPYKGLRIIHNIHLTLSTICKLEPLLVSGAHVTVTTTKDLKLDPEAREILIKAGVDYREPDEVDDDYDFVLDCCAGLLHKVNPRKGAVELTQTGALKYANANMSYPIVSVDDSELKKFETLFGTGDGFIRAFLSLIKESINNKKFIIFGYGKVGKGIVHALQPFTEDLVVIEINQASINEALSENIKALHIGEHEKILNELKESFCVVTATGNNGVISHFFERSDFASVGYLANMGSEDEYGEKFSKDDVLFKKQPLNFSLKEPTKIKYLDPVFYAHNTAIDFILNAEIKHGFNKLPQHFDLEVLHRWSNYHQVTFSLLEQKIRQSATYYQHVIDHIPGFVFWKDKDSRFLGCNLNFAKAAGLNSSKEIIGKTDYDLYWGKTHAEIFREGDQQVMKGFPKINVEEPQLQADGEIKTILVNKIPLLDEEGSISGVIGLYSDITDRKKIEEELLIAKEKAEIASQAKTQFLAVASHEMRMPLTGIMSVADMFTTGLISSPEEVRKYAQIMLESGHYLLSNIDSILYYAKLESEKYVLTVEPIHLKEFIEQLTSTLVPLAHQKGLILETDIADDLPVVMADTTALRHIALNLIGNAIRYTDQGSVKVIMKCLAAPKTRAKIEFAVQDTGIGIPEDKLESIFDKFTQIEDAYVRKNSRSGFGLGLSIVRKFVELLRGKISVESKLGVGSCFKFQCDFMLPKGKKDEGTIN